MRIIVDTNILFSFFWKKSILKELLNNPSLELFSPEFALEEIKKYKNEIIKKTKISEDEFNRLRKELAVLVDFLSLEEYHEFLKKAILICPDPNDIDFFALALKLETTLWSNDLRLKKQEVINVMTTKDLLNNFEFLDYLEK